MRKPFVAGNWKMNKTIAETRELISAMAEKLNEIKNVEKVVCPPFVSLQTAREFLKNTEIGLGAQNMFWEEKGAFTGETSPAMIKELCNYVILGHSERRAYFGETDALVNKKLLAAQKFDLTPIVCVGETLEQYESNLTGQVVSEQVKLSLAGLHADYALGIVVAYEPVWAIGTGKASTGEAANAVVKDVIRPALAELYGGQTAQSSRVLYGGSVTGANAKEFFSPPDIVGSLVGGDSFKADYLVAIKKAAG
ncbi:MAG: triose-phosphate isomerase [Anaerolineales bacterium]